MSAFLATAAVILSGVLAPAAPGVLEDVQARRIKYGWGLEQAAPAGTVLLATEDCGWLGANGLLFVDGTAHRVRVVDCQRRDEAPRLSDLGILADTNAAELAHEYATLVLW